MNVAEMEECIEDCYTEIDGDLSAAKEYLQAVTKAKVACVDAISCHSYVNEVIAAVTQPNMGSSVEAAQENDDVIWKVLRYKQKRRRPRLADMKKETRGVQRLLRKWKEIEIDKKLGCYRDIL